jgi:hypothetical protein
MLSEKLPADGTDLFELSGDYILGGAGFLVNMVCKNMVRI